METSGCARPALNKHLSLALKTTSALPRSHVSLGLLPVLQRQDFKDWTKPLDEARTGNVDSNVERRQWHSGTELYMSLLEATIDKMGLTAEHGCHVRDWTLYDNSLAMAVMNLPCTLR